MPAGLDTDVLIGGICDSEPTTLEKLAAADLSGTEDIDLTVAQNASSDGNPTVSSEEQPSVLEDEQAWLSNLQTEIEQGL